ncbi:MAG: ABC transporter permease subunit [Chitinophagaceae bacterium]|nr:ABC transporter permease subunit [Anaerolineae bacterium]
MTDTLELNPSPGNSGTLITPVLGYKRKPDENVKTLSYDLLALLTLFLIVVTYHIQNPLLQFERQFGKAFRNESLQPVTAIGLFITVLVFIMPWASLRRNVLRFTMSALLILYSVYMVTAIVLDYNLSGQVFIIPQIAFHDNLDVEEPALAELRDNAMNALRATTVMEIIALAAVVGLWQPWRRWTIYRKALQKYTSALVVGFIVLISWEVLINIFKIEEFLLPRPSVIAATFLDIYPRLISVGWNTFVNAFWGFTFGCGLGILAGIISARFVTFSRALLPLAIGINAVPIIALAPIMNNWFGALNPSSKVAIVAILVFFPSMISAVRGLNSADAVSLELMKSYAASELEIFRKLRLPSALPFIFSALKVATTLSMIGAIVSEYFGGSTQGLGYRIRDDAGLFKYPEAWSAIFVAALFGIFFYLLVSAAERAFMSWHVSFREK